VTVATQAPAPVVQVQFTVPKEQFAPENLAGQLQLALDELPSAAMTGEHTPPLLHTFVAQGSLPEYDRLQLGPYSGNGQEHRATIGPFRGGWRTSEHVPVPHGLGLQGLLLLLLPVVPPPVPVPVEVLVEVEMLYVELHVGPSNPAAQAHVSPTMGATVQLPPTPQRPAAADAGQLQAKESRGPPSTEDTAEQIVPLGQGEVVEEVHGSADRSTFWHEGPK
jgi:hypothetical protein